MTIGLLAAAEDEVASLAADVVADALTGRRSVAFSGGSTPAAMLDELTRRDVDWSGIDVFQVDERVAPDGHPDRNLELLRSALLDRVEPRTVHAMPVEAADLTEAASSYADRLPERLDVVVLGLGDDGHTASLVPGDPVLDVTDRDVAITLPYRGRIRMTLTYPALDRAHQVIWLVQGEAKRPMLDRLRAADRGIPAGRVRAAAAVVVADHAAAGTSVPGR